VFVLWRSPTCGAIDESTGKLNVDLNPDRLTELGIKWIQRNGWILAPGVQTGFIKKEDVVTEREGEFENEFFEFEDELEDETSER